MTKLVKYEEFDAALREEVGELGGSGLGGKMLKFDANSQKYTLDKVEVALGGEYIAHVDQYARGWTKFVDKKPVENRILRLTEGKPEKPEPNLDEETWSDDQSDGWTFYRYQPFEDVKTGEIIVFVSKSVGGKIALGNLLQDYRGTRHLGNPIVKLAIGTFKSGFGPKPRPDFQIIGRTGGEAQMVEGPPDDDPTDPRDYDDEIR